MYFGGLLNGQPFYSQPGGPFTQVFPTQVDAQPWPDYPIPGQILQETNPWWFPNCQHSLKFWSVIREWDYDENIDCALICCSICSYIQAVYRPFDSWLNPIEHSIIVA